MRVTRALSIDVDEIVGHVLDLPHRTFEPSTRHGVVALVTAANQPVATGDAS